MNVGRVAPVVGVALGVLGGADRTWRRTGSAETIEWMVRPGVDRFDQLHVARGTDLEVNSRAAQMLDQRHSARRRRVGGDGAAQKHRRFLERTLPRGDFGDHEGEIERNRDREGGTMPRAAARRMIVVMLVTGAHGRPDATAAAERQPRPVGFDQAAFAVAGYARAF